MHLFELKFFMKLILIFCCVLITLTGFTQDTTVIVTLPIHKSQVDISGKVKRMLHNNGIMEDSMIVHLNTKFTSAISRLMPGVRLVFCDSMILRQMLDSSSATEMFTTTHLRKVSDATGFKKIKTNNNNGVEKRYTGRSFNPYAISMGKKEMDNQKAIKFIMINRIEIKYSGSSGFVVHYELYDKDFNRIYGDRYDHFLNISRDMYYSTFTYYLNYCVEDLCTKLSLQVK